MSNISSLLGNTDLFLDILISSLNRDGIDVSGFELDHICYRVETSQEYIHYKQELSKLGKLLVEAKIGGRLISTYKLTDPIIFRDRKIYVLELPSPKEGSQYAKGLEHIEFVIKDNFKEFIDRYSNVKFDTSDIANPVNASIRIRYSECSAKFHYHSLEHVIKCESNPILIKYKKKK